jgi:hypothetical protein
MKHSQIHEGSVYETDERGWKRLAKVVEVGEYTDHVYSGSRDWRGHDAKVKGARVAYLDDAGTPRLTKTEWKFTPGTPESSYIDSFDGATVVVPATEDVREEIVVDATQWVPSRNFSRTLEEHTALQERLQKEAVRKARYAEQTANLRPCIKETLSNAGISTYIGDYTDKVEFSLLQLQRLIDHLDPTGEARQKVGG